MTVFAAVDIGASSGRVVRGVVQGDRVEVDAVHRFDNGVVDHDGHLRWDIAAIHREVVAGLARIPDAVSIGIDTWGVDYGLIDQHGTLLADPISYRDDRTAKVIDSVHRLVPPDELYAITGIQHLPFNTIYQLACEQHLDRARRALLLPDLLVYLLTGATGTELTNASTTALLDVRTRAWSMPLFERLGFPVDLFPPIDRPGRERGTFRGVPVVTVGSHDTASAVAGVPSAGDDVAYISSGTWSLVGTVLDEPVLTEQARAANFTNEIAIDGRVRFLRNVGGLWLLQECMRSWGRDDLHALLVAAAAVDAPGRHVDADDPSFIAPDDMPERIGRAAGGAMTAPETVRCILDSLARGYARAVDCMVALTRRAVDTIHVVGGGSRNELLCQLTADTTGRTVLAGPAEATAVGNVLVQARAHGLDPEPVAPVRRYEPS